MKSVLYLTNIEVPYRVRMFNEFAKHCDLTVAYERRKSRNRNQGWTASEEQKFNRKYFRGINIKNENAFSLGLLREVLSGYDVVIVGCYNSPVQMAAIMLMRMLRKPYILNLDGEVFLRGNGIKTAIKRFFLVGAQKYLVAGENAAESVKTVANDKPIIPYHFSSLSKAELQSNREVATFKRDNYILVIGQYFDYKGMDIALCAARMDPGNRYRFVGMGGRTNSFIEDYHIHPDENVEIIPFLQKKELEKEYNSCAMVVLPSRQECWGLVINEAASFGTPIVSTWGSGAAVEFLSAEYPQFLAKQGDAEDLHRCIQRLVDFPDKKQYSSYLMEKSQKYSIEENVQVHVLACNES